MHAIQKRIRAQTQTQTKINGLAVEPLLPMAPLGPSGHTAAIFSDDNGSPEPPGQQNHTPIRKSDTKSTTSLSPAASYFLDSVPSDDNDGAIAVGVGNGHGHGHGNGNGYHSPKRVPPGATLVAHSPNLSTHRRLDRAIDFMEDDPSTMTFSRRAAIFLADRYAWYNPRKNLVVDEMADVDMNGIDNNNDREGINVNSKDVYRAIRTRSDANNDNGDIEVALEYNNVEIQQRPNVDGNHGPNIKAAWAFYEHMTLPRRLADPKNEFTGPSGTSSNSNSNSNHSNDKDKMNSDDAGDMNMRRRSFSSKIGDALAGRGKALKVAVAGETMYETRLYSPWTTPLGKCKQCVMRKNMKIEKYACARVA